MKTFNHIIMKLSCIIAVLFLAAGCQQQSRELIGIMILTDKETFNPILEPDVTGNISMLGIYSNGKNKEITDGEVVYKAETKLASGDVNVIRLEGNKIIPVEGGMARIMAVVLKDGKTYKAEKDIVVRPFYHDYHQTLVLKIFNLRHPDVDPEYICTFEETLEIIRKTDNLTREIPKILYLQGWQQGGFDMLFPAWNIVDPRLKRDQDESALESLRWLMREAKKYNTIVSLHIDMVQARVNSPLWDEYVKKDIVGRDEDGKIILHERFPGEMNFNHISYTREWEEGLAQKRIDGLIEMVPELVDAHTVHMDNLITYWKAENRPLSPWHARPDYGGIDMYKETETIRKIFKYWRAREIDLTGEGILWAHPPGEGFYGLQGYSWWGRGTEHSMQVPERLSARGASARAESGDVKMSDYRVGSSMHGARIWIKDKENMTGLLEQFCAMTLPYYYLSRHERIALIDETLYYSDGLVAGEVNGRRTIRKGDYVLVEDDNVFVEAKWKEKEIIAYSKQGYSNKQWVMPKSWEGVKGLDLYEISIDGLELIESGKKIENGRLELSLDKDQAVSIVPIGSVM
jgi:hypothetical protein